MKTKDILQIPLVDDEGRIVGSSFSRIWSTCRSGRTGVVLMAGGLGSRLGELTEECPKPLLKIGKKPILETILGSFIRHGFRKFYFSVNYLSEMIENHFRDGSKWGVSHRVPAGEQAPGHRRFPRTSAEGPLRPLHRHERRHPDQRGLRQAPGLPLWTAGPRPPCACANTSTRCPTGWSRPGASRLTGIEEKPVSTYFVNAGIYVLEPSCLNVIPSDSFFDMTDLFSGLTQGREAAVYPVRDYWLDIGRVDDLKRAHGEYCKHFVPNGEEQ